MSSGMSGSAAWHAASGSAAPQLAYHTLMLRSSCVSTPHALHAADALSQLVPYTRWQRFSRKTPVQPSAAEHFM